MKKLTFLFISLFTLFFYGCESTDDALTPSDVIRTITARVQEDNALRVDVTVSLKQAANYSIEYWKQDDEQHSRCTEPASAEGEHTTTLIFLEADTEYCFRILAESGQGAIESDVYTFHTRSLPVEIPSFEVERDELKETLPGYLLMSRMDKKPGFIIFTNLEGKVVWYHLTPGTTVQTVSYDSIHRTLQCITGTHPTQNYACEGMMVLDLYGRVLVRKNIANLYPHHDIKRMPDGNLVMVHFVPKTCDLTSQGGGKEDTVMGDGILVMDMQGNVVWQWDCFSVLNPAEDPDIIRPVQGLLPDKRGDWLHVNSVSFDEKGDFYITSNWLSQLWKIERSTGRLVYKLGKGGTVSMDKEKFMSGVHNSTPLSPDRIMVFDNGMAATQSRVSIFTVDPLAQSVTESKTIDLPVEFKSPFQGGMSVVNEDLLVVNSSLSNAILFMDFSGNIFREIRTGYRVYRADYVNL